MSDSDLELAQPPNPNDMLFTTAEDWWNNACLNFFHDGWAVYTIGYKDAADILVDYVQSHERRHDTLVYPVVFLYRQYLELALKDLIRQSRKLLGDREPCPMSHRLDALWKLCDSLLEQIFPGDSAEHRKEIGRLIREFAEVDPLSMAFRYPEDRAGNPSLPGLTNINLRNVREVIGKISVILEGADAQLDEYHSFMSEIMP